eukprot:jgi/Botrbrau1/14586/Bobra.0312s0009.1
MAAVVQIGGVTSSSPFDDLLKIVAGGHALLDEAAAERIKKESPPPSAFTVAENRADASPPGPIGALLSDRQTRAVVCAKLLALVQGHSKVRRGVLEVLIGLLNEASTLPLTDSTSNGALLCQLAQAVQSAPPAAPGLSEDEWVSLETGQAAGAGVGALALVAAGSLLQAATCIAALSAEALGADVRSWEEAADESRYSGASSVAGFLRGLTVGSRLINPRKGGAFKSVFSVVVPAHGAAEVQIKAALTAVKAELASGAPSPDKAREQDAPYELIEGLAGARRAVNRLSKQSIVRIHLLNRASTLKKDDAVAAVKAACDRAKCVTLPKIDDLNNDYEEGDSWGEAWAASLAVQALQQTLALEGVLAVQLLEQKQLLSQLEQADQSSLKKPKKEKGGDKAGGSGTGKGTAVVRTWLEAVSGIETDARGVPEPSKDHAVPPGTGGTQEGSTADGGGVGTNSPSPALQRIMDALDPLGTALETNLAAIRAAVEANAPRRKPKIPKGTRDFLPDQMMIRREAFNKIARVFERHGAVSIDTPVFELRETLMGKYGEDSKLIYDLADQGGEILSLRYDLTVPFARYVALHGVGNIKRYHIAKVYRRDQPQMNRGRFREFFQCDFDIAGDYPPMIPDAEVLKVLVEILTDLDIGNFEIKLNHRKLLDGMMRLCGVPASKFRAICSAIDKLDKEPWSAVREEMVAQKGLSPEVADKIQPFVEMRGPPEELVEKLCAEGSPFRGDPDAEGALADLRLLCQLLQSLGGLGPIVLDLSLARGLDYYTGVIYEAVLQGATVGSIAAGGRYDGLVGMFSGKDKPAVGVSIGIERVFALLEEKYRSLAAAGQGKIRENDIQVLVTSVGKGLQGKRMEVCARLWAAGIPAEFGYKANPNLKDQLGYADENGIPFVVLFGDTELEQGVFKLKSMRAGTEEDVPQEKLVEVLQDKLQALGPLSIIATRITTPAPSQPA